MVELSLILLASYLLVVGLFVQRLTASWLWSSFGLSFASFIFFFVGFKNLILFDFFYGLNLGNFFVLIFASFIGYHLFNQQTTKERDFLSWILFFSFFIFCQTFFIGDFSCFQTNLVESFWVGIFNGGTFYHDLKLLILIVTLITFTAVYHRGVHFYEFDYAVLLVLGCLASLFLLTQDNLMMIYLNLEFQALILYVLTTYYRFEETNSEAGLKYLLLGSLLSGFFLIGLLIFYFSNGSLNLTELTLVEGQIWLIANFLFKLGVVPFYFWTPSVYQQMDYPSLIFISILPKLSVWFLLFKIFSPFLNLNLFYWSGILSIIIGAVGGLYQLTISSLVAYSGMLNAGYLLLFVDQPSSEIIFMLSLYLVGYYLILSLILSVFSFFQSNFITEFTSLATVGTYFSLLVYYFFLSLSGLPVLPGFSTKLYLLGFVLERNLFEAFVIVLFSLFGVVYYLRVVGHFLFYQPRSSSKSYVVHFFYYLFLILFFNSLLQSLLSFW